jgi:Ca2+-transporting ATPase
MRHVASRARALIPTPNAFHAFPFEAVLRALESHPEGLSRKEVERRTAQFGPNTLDVTSATPAWRIALAQLKSLVVVLLIVAAVVSLALGDLLEALAIGAVLLANTSIGFWVEWRARNSMEALRRIQINPATVIREGEVSRIDARDLVPGDLILVEAGEAIPADARLLSTRELRVIEAPLTGEPIPISKDPKPNGDPSDPEVIPLADRRCMIYKGTLAVAGSGRAVVVGTGSETEVGRIAELVQSTEAEDTPLEARLAVLGRQLVGLTLGVTIVVTLLGIVRGGDPWLMLQTGIALAIAAVPEGLPVVATVTLALGMRRMARRHALVRSLPVVEGLGSATVVCADKTGTLTAGDMTVTRMEIAGASVSVSGTGLEPSGSFTTATGEVDPSRAPELSAAIEIGVLTNRAHLTKDPEQAGGIRLSGDPTEGALLVLGMKAGIDRAALTETHPELGELPFTSERLMMATLHRDPDGGRALFVKGAPGRVLRASTSRLSSKGTVPLDEAARRSLAHKNEELGGQGLRVLALARRTLPSGTELEESVLTDLEFVGFVGLEDPPASGVRETIERLSGAGVRTVMITGDQTVTARAIALQLGLDPSGARTLEGRELADMDDEELQRRTESVVTFSRTQPADKLRIVQAFRRRGEIVAMLGDGVNDAPALKRADIGVAMGGRGTDVAKETAGLVLQDDRFETIGAAVEEGRVAFDNIRKFIFYLFSCNLSEVLVILGAALVGLPIPLLPLQILWLNLITDVFPALALAVEPPEDDVMARPPRSPDAAILSRPFVKLVVRHGVIITVATLAAFLGALRGMGLEVAITVAFVTLAFAQLFHVFNARSHQLVLFSRRLLRNGWVWLAILLSSGLQVMAVHYPPLSRVLDTVPLSPGGWTLALSAALAPLMIGQLSKARAGAMP